MENFVIIPFQSLNKNFKRKLKDLTITNTSGEVVGTVLTNMNNCGLAMVDKTLLSKSSKLSIEGLNTIVYDPLTLYETIHEFNKI